MKKCAMIYDRKKITSLREDRGWSMAELARQAKMSQPSLWSLEHGYTKKPKAETLFAIAAALGVTVQQIMPSNKGGNSSQCLDITGIFAQLSPENQSALFAAASALKNSQK